MKLWTTVCLALLPACASSPNGNDSGGTGGSHSPSQGGSAGTVNSSTGGSAGATQTNGGSAGTTGGSQGGTMGGSPAAGGTTSAAGGTSSAAGGKVGAGGDKPASGGSTAGGSGGRASGGDAATGGKIGAGGTTASGGSAGTASGGKSGGAGGSVGSGGGTATTGKNHVFLLLGQSNMAGYPAAQSSDKDKNTQIQVIGFDNCAATGRKQDQWDVAVPPLHECSPGAIGPGDWFSKTIIGKYPAGDTIWLVPNAFSGEKIATMRKGGTHWSTMISRAKKGQEKGPIEGMLFHQGESDCGNADWPSWVKGMYTELKSDLSLTKDVPFLVGELPPSSACMNHNPLVAKVPGLIGSNAYVISSQGLKIDPADTQWNMHFDHDSQVTFGKRYADTMITALGL